MPIARRKSRNTAATPDENFDWLVMATGSTGTQAGLVAGFAGARPRSAGHGCQRPPTARAADERGPCALTIRKRSKNSEQRACRSAKLLVDDGYVGEGYGIPADSTLEAIRLAAQQEGILLDPVYSAKGMAGLIGMVRQGFLQNVG